MEYRIKQSVEKKVMNKDPYCIPNRAANTQKHDNQQKKILHHYHYVQINEDGSRVSLIVRQEVTIQR